MRIMKSFTLIELIMVIVLVGIIAGVITPFLANSFRYWVLTRSERDAIFSARLAINRMVREIREIKNVSSITVFTPTQFTFTDINDNSIDFRQSGSSLMRNSYELSDKLQNPGGLTFTYLDQNGNVTAVQNDIRMVRIGLILQKGDATVTLESLARFRNL